MHRQFFHLENSAKITGFTSIGPVDRNYISSNMAGKSIATQRIMHHSLSMVYRQVLLLHPHLLLQQTVTPTEHPASTRSESMSEEVRGNSSRGKAEDENPNKNDDNEGLHRKPVARCARLATGVQAWTGG